MAIDNLLIYLINKIFLQVQSFLREWAYLFLEKPCDGHQKFLKKKTMQFNFLIKGIRGKKEKKHRL